MVGKEEGGGMANGEWTMPFDRLRPRALVEGMEDGRAEEDIGG